MQEDQLQEGRGNSLFTVKNVIILLLGFVLGYFLKLQAKQTITMGYDDYKLSQWQSNFKSSNIEDDGGVDQKAVTQDNEDANANNKIDK